MATLVEGSLGIFVMAICGLIVACLKESDGNRSEAARRLGISRATLHEKLHKHGLASSGEE